MGTIQELKTSFWTAFEEHRERMTVEPEEPGELVPEDFDDEEFDEDGEPPPVPLRDFVNATGNFAVYFEHSENTFDHFESACLKDAIDDLIDQDSTEQLRATLAELIPMFRCPPPQPLRRPQSPCGSNTC